MGAVTSQGFCWWLQGYLELFQAGNEGNAKGMTREQVECLQRHLAMVFLHEIDPSMGGKSEQAKLDAAHDPSANTSPVQVTFGGHGSHLSGPVMRW